MAYPLIIAGLGNPGPRYDRTRHNAGFLVLERLRSAAGGSWVHREDRDEAWIRLEGVDRLLVRPLTYMNRSGGPLAGALASAQLGASDLLVIVDDVALPFGRLRIRRQGGPGGHNGLVSVCESLATQEIPRLRLGVGLPPPEIDLAEFVLEPLAGEDWDRMAELTKRAEAAVRMICAEGLTAAMNRFHPPEPSNGGGS